MNGVGFCVCIQFVGDWEIWYGQNMVAGHGGQQSCLTENQDQCVSFFLTHLSRMHGFMLSK